MSKKRGRCTYWKLKVDEEGLIWVWGDSKFNIWSMSIVEVYDWLATEIKPNDEIIYSGFTKTEFTINGKQFMEVYDGPT